MTSEFVVAAIVALGAVLLVVLIARQVHDDKRAREDPEQTGPGYVCLAHRHAAKTGAEVSHCACVPPLTDDEIDNPNWPHGRL